MPLVKVKDILHHATENGYGVPAINVINFETAKYVIEGAEREKTPIIVQFFPGFAEYCPLHIIAYIGRSLAEAASVPVAIHLDHSTNFDIAVSGIRYGFPSIMVDGSSLPFEENLTLTSEVTKICRVYGLDIESELGHFWNAGNAEDFENTDLFTKVDQAVEFVQNTGCDSLAVAVGNAHGNYIKKPKLDFDRIRDLRKALNVPLVLHGSSGIPDDQIQEAVHQGMSKFNIATEYFAAMQAAFKASTQDKDVGANGVALMFSLREPMIDFVVKKIRLLNPNKFTLQGV